MPMGMTERIYTLIVSFTDGVQLLVRVILYKVNIASSYRRGGLELLVPTVMGNSYGLRLWSE